MVVMQETPTQEIESGPGEQSDARSNALLCAALLASGRHLNGKEIATLLEVDAAEVPAAVAALARQLSESRLGILVEAVAGGWRLVVDPTLNPALTRLLDCRVKPGNDIWRWQYGCERETASQIFLSPCQ